MDCLSFNLDNKFILRYIGKQPDWGPLGYVTYKRTYSRSLASLYERHMELGLGAGLEKAEEFWLTLTRVVEGTFSIIKDHCRALRLPWNEPHSQSMAQEMFTLMWKFKFSPPGRGLWIMGTPVVSKVGGAALNNCAFVSTAGIDYDFTKPFTFLMDMTMLGVGVGADCKGAGTVNLVPPAEGLGDTHYVQDSREGWCDALDLLLKSYITGQKIPLFNFSLIRARGTALQTFGGTAAGPAVLQDLFTDIKTLLDRSVYGAITSGVIVDLFNLIGKHVAAGGARRSAEILFGESKDELFMDLKNPEINKKDLESHRWASNNSVFCSVGDSYRGIAKRIAKNGEPGIIWLDNAQAYGRMSDDKNWKDEFAGGANPCLEQTLESGELCCLVETYPAHHENLKDYQHTLKYAYLYAKAVTLVPTHNQYTNAILLRNRRIGCSMSGITQAIAKLGMRKFINWCDKSYQFITENDYEYSRWLCVPPSIKTTSVKPSGTVSLLCGATPGIHYPVSEYYYRVIRFDSASSLLYQLKEQGYTCVEIEKEPHTTAVYFPVKEKDFTRSESQVSMWEQLELAATLQAHWADNQVSVTVKFDKDEGKDIEKALEFYETRLKGVSFLPKETGIYEHAPYQPITKEQYLEAIARLSTRAILGGAEVEDKFCDSDKCTI